MDIVCTAFTELDAGLISDFLTSVDEVRDEIGDCLDRLKKAPDDTGQLNQLFRSVHNLKGNCRMVFLEAIVPTVHVLEDVLDKLRKNEFGCSDELSAFVLEVIEVTRVMIREAAEKSIVNAVHRDEIIRVIALINTQLSAGQSPDFDTAIAQLSNKSIVVVSPGLNELPCDLMLMKDYANALDNLTMFRRGRSPQILQLCRHLNAAYRSPVNSEQLEAAVYMHDFGMSLVNPQILQKDTGLDKDELRQIQHHVFFGARFLQRMGGWDEAALYVLQHHERMNSTGYPYRIEGSQITTGAKILAIADAFFSVTSERSDRTYKKTLFGAVRELNGNAGTQFDAEFVEIFNDVIRDHYLSGQT